MMENEGCLTPNSTGVWGAQRSIIWSILTFVYTRNQSKNKEVTSTKFQKMKDVPHQIPPVSRGHNDGSYDYFAHLSRN